MPDHEDFLNTDRPLSPYRKAIEARVTAYFTAYCLMGPNRSLEGLLGVVEQVGLKPVALSTIKRWSYDYGWQGKVVQIDVRARQRALPQLVDTIADMNLRQAQAGRIMQAVGMVGIESRDPELITPRDAATLVDIGSKLERLASGAATSRAEIMVSVWSELVREIVVLFLEINNQEDSEDRKRRFATGVDALVDSHISQQGMRN